jgi:hypothetical protein
LTDLVKSLVKAMEGQEQKHQNQIEALTRMHENQTETITATVTQQSDTLKEEMAGIAEQIKTQLSSLQASSPSPSYAEVARTPPNSWPSIVQTRASMGTTPSRMTDTLSCIIDTSRIGDEDRNKAHQGAIRKAVEEEIRAGKGQQSGAVRL